jgi:hypothetical protein
VFDNVYLPGARMVAGIKASDAFFAPLIFTVPLRGFPPCMTNLSIDAEKYSPIWSEKQRQLGSKQNAVSRYKASIYFLPSANSNLPSPH